MGKSSVVKYRTIKGRIQSDIYITCNVVQPRCRRHLCLRSCQSLLGCCTASIGLSLAHPVRSSFFFYRWLRVAWQRPDACCSEGGSASFVRPNDLPQQPEWLCLAAVGCSLGLLLRIAGLVMSRVKWLFVGFCSHSAAGARSLRP